LQITTLLFYLLVCQRRRYLLVTEAGDNEVSSGNNQAKPLDLCCANMDKLDNINNP
jgi:hypothetical protein